MLLLPEHFPTRPFDDSAHLLGEPEALRARIAEQGYLFFGKLLDAPLLDPLRAWVRQRCVAHGWVQPDPANGPEFAAQVGATMAGAGYDDPRWVGLQRELSRAPEFVALADGEPLAGLMETLCEGPATRATVNFCWLKLPGQPEHTTLPHQDLFYLHQCPLMWTVWVPLVDTPLSLGPLGVVPGSGREGVLPHVSPAVGMQVPRDTEWATAGVTVGDVVVFGALTVHCAWSNVTSDRVRASFDLRYQPTHAASGVRVMTPTARPD